jgi:uncharacterized SAM-binding protein YcdF (DUF218 family)
MSEFVTIAFSSTAALVALLLAAAWFLRSRGSRAARRFMLLVIGFYALSSTWVVPYAVGRALVAGYHPFASLDVPSGPTAILVLGAGNFGVEDWDTHQLWMLDPVGGARVQETLRVYRMIPGAVIISSGGLPDPAAAVEPAAITMRRAFIAAGVPADRIVVQPASRNTHDEATLTAPIVRALGVRHVVLVTTDIHMRRSDGVFRAAGIDVIPAIVRDPYATWGWRAHWLPTSYGLQLSAQVTHEFLGLAVYGARGWIR